MSRFGHALALGLVLLGSGAFAQGQASRYPQKTLLKNWALSRCLAQVHEDAGTRADAQATAAAYLEFGRQPIEAYEAIGKLVDAFAARRYGSVSGSDLRTMKCIDLFHSPELEAVSARWARSK